MKQLLSVLLLALFLFNWCGYRLLSSFLEDNTSRELDMQLDNNNYDTVGLISIRIPAKHMSPYSNAKLFERKDGQVEIDGIPYRYVKQRLYNDSLELWCIPNKEIIKLKSAGAEYFKLVNGLQWATHGKKATANTGISKSISAEYFLPDDIFIGGIFLTTLLEILPTRTTIHSCFVSSVIENPPEHLLQTNVLNYNFND